MSAHFTKPPKQCVSFFSSTEAFDILPQVALVDMLWSFTHTSISE